MGTLVGLVTQSAMCLLICFPSVRCWLLLAVPSLITSKLRAVILLFILIWCFQVGPLLHLLPNQTNVFLQVPAMNITTNIQKSAEAISCVQMKITRAAEESREEANKDIERVKR